ncbi:MAG: type IVB secretion system protein IcmM/DotJ [Legionella sp.]|nr:type IVB secretion system protein IcmM/DotJ [Legionella sp.]
MSRGNWNRIKLSKFFYVNMYRKLMTLIIASQGLNVLFCLAVTYTHLQQPERTFYATSGIIPPIKLNPLDAANKSAEALLPPDPVDDNEIKVIPE